MSMFKNKKITGTIAATAVSAFLPLVALAQAGSIGGNVGRIDDVFRVVESFVNRATPFIIGLSVFIIIWGVFKLLTKIGGDDGKAREEAQRLIFWGIIGVFIMISIWGLVRILTNTIILETTRPNIPDVFPR